MSLVMSQGIKLVVGHFWSALGQVNEIYAEIHLTSQPRAPTLVPSPYLALIFDEALEYAVPYDIT